MEIKVNDTVWFFDCDRNLRTGTVMGIFDAMGASRRQYAKVRLSHSGLGCLNVELPDLFPTEEACLARKQREIGSQVYFLDWYGNMYHGRIVDRFLQEDVPYVRISAANSPRGLYLVKETDCFPDPESCLAARDKREHRSPDTFSSTNAFSAELKSLGYKYILRCGDVCWAMKNEPLILTEGTIPAWLNRFQMNGVNPSEINYHYIAPGSYAHI